MLVVLDIRKDELHSFMQKLKAIFRPYEISADIIAKNDIAVLHIRYKQKRGSIRFNKIYKYTVGVPKTVLCSNDLSLTDTPFTRFESDEFNIQMMKNFICSALKTADIPPSELKISFFDPTAEYPLFAEKLLNFTSCMTVVSNMPKFYENESERHLNELGVSTIVSNSTEKLTPCDILICPSKIKVHLPTKTSSLIFTGHRPLVNVSGTVITRYTPEFPVKFKEIKPECVDDFYFLSALYTLCGITELEKLTPQSCECDTAKFSLEQTVKMIKTHCAAYSAEKQKEVCSD
ncbi:MAG: hypothetical protein PUG48_04670 [Clostridia bacterium]|nr:hypothetical protein [Clostridia bacterium]